MKRTLFPGAIVGALLALLAPPALAQSAPDVDPDAVAALSRMGTFLRSLKAFQVNSESVKDEVLNTGERVAFGGKTELLVATPNRLRAEVAADRQHRMFFYDGKNFTLYAMRLGYYATAPAPPTLREFIDRLADKYDIEIPLADLFLFGTDRAPVSAIRSATDIGPSQINGTSCEHY